jgi:hypothetical protein
MRTLALCAPSTVEYGDSRRFVRQLHVVVPLIHSSPAGTGKTEVVVEAVLQALQAGSWGMLRSSALVPEAIMLVLWGHSLMSWRALTLSFAFLNDALVGTGLQVAICAPSNAATDELASRLRCLRLSCLLAC